MKNVIQWILQCLIMFYRILLNLFEPPRDKTNKMICVPSEDSAQPGHLPSLTRVFAVRSMGS